MNRDQNLLRAMQQAYKKYIEGDVVAFDDCLAAICAGSGGNPQEIANKIRRILHGR